MDDLRAQAPVPFVKMHGLGNDFVVIDRRHGGPAVTPVLARALGDRHRGVGFDQLVVVEASTAADARLSFLNSDGSASAACGNGSRCVARMLMTGTGRDRVTLETARGVLAARDAADGLTAVNMGQPDLDWQAIPLAWDTDTLNLPIEGSPAAVGMGNPHCIYFVDDAETVDLARDGAAAEHHPLYPEATNVEYVSVLGPDRLRMRVWERGAGITLACGSGACAVAVAAHRRGLTGRRVQIVLDGGVLALDWRDDGVWMTGPTAQVFAGVLSAEFLALV